MKHTNIESLNYSNNKRQNKKRYHLLLLMVSVVLLFGIVFAYFNDMASDSGEFKTGTLEITAEYEYYLNGVKKPLIDMKNLNPGDVIVIKVNIKNNGNKSAWTREKISLSTTDQTLLQYFEVYNGEFTQNDLINGVANEFIVELEEGQAILPNKVIDGTGDNAETESGESYTYVKNSSYDAYITLYFLPTATNEVQGKTFSLVVMTQALQFRNNNATLPKEEAWAAVSTTTK